MSLKKKLFVIDLIAVVTILITLNTFEFIYTKITEQSEIYNYYGLMVGATVCYFLVSSLMVFFAIRIGQIVKVATSSKPR